MRGAIAVHDGIGQGLRQVDVHPQGRILHDAVEGRRRARAAGRDQRTDVDAALGDAPVEGCRHVFEAGEHLVLGDPRGREGLGRLGGGALRMLRVALLLGHRTRRGVAPTLVRGTGQLGLGTRGGELSAGRSQFRVEFRRLERRERLAATNRIAEVCRPRRHEAVDAPVQGRGVPRRGLAGQARDRLRIAALDEERPHRGNVMAPFLGLRHEAVGASDAHDSDTDGQKRDEAEEGDGGPRSAARRGVLHHGFFVVHATNP